MTTMTAAAAPSTDPPTRRGWLGQLGVDSAYVLVGLPLAVLAFSLVLTGLSLGIGLIPLMLLGIPVLVGALYLARGFAEVERSRIAPVLRRRRAAVRYRRAPREASALRRLVAPLGEVQYWLDALHGVLRLPISIATWTVAVNWWSIALFGLSYGLWEWSLPTTLRQHGLMGDEDSQTLLDLVGITEPGQAHQPGFYILTYLGLGAFFALTLPFVIRACALAEAWVAHGLLNGVAGLRAEVAELARDRDTAKARTAAAVSAEATALRRLERDIHDGPQQRLVRLAVDLGRARQQLESNPTAAAATVDEALAQARETLDELRTLSRGIAPPILTDRGLAAATAALAARATVPVTVDMPDLPRLPALVEQTAYFTIAESLANAAKHSGATGCAVTALVASDHQLIVTITDDGQGGAAVAKGHGLAGLTDRLQAAGGALWISSPAGGPTIIRATLPAGTAPEGSAA